ncbi:MAG: hypothetical protein HY282_13305 [Nitrospirae bacterium]|nr:hypothetical protein [Candidatus Manganitrophaceae bacterium]
MKRLTWVLLSIFFVLSPDLPASAIPPCPPKGEGGDPALNRLKNRIDAPATYEMMTVAQFLETLTPNLHAAKDRSDFSLAHRLYVDRNEARGITLEGYLLHAKQAGPEGVNCYSKTRRDFLLWIGAKHPMTLKEAEAMRPEGVRVDATPAGQHQHKSWRLHTLKQWAKEGTRIRVSGWALYDSEHPGDVGKTRGSLWEVHPVTKIEIWDGETWKEL